MPAKPVLPDSKVVSHLLDIGRRIVSAARDPDAEYDIRVSSYEGDVGEGQLTQNKAVLFSGNAYRIGLTCNPDKYTLPIHVEVVATVVDEDAFRTECLGLTLLPNGDKDAFVREAMRAVLNHMREWKLGIR